MTFKINPFKSVSFKESAVLKVLEATGVIAAIKYDGVRCHLLITPAADIDGQPAANLVAMSRTDKVIPALRELYTSDAHKILLGQLLAESLYPDGIMIDGEALVKGVDFQTGSGLLRRKTALKASDLEFMVYGILPISELKEDAKKTVDVPYCIMFEQVRVLMCQLRELLPEVSWHQEETFEVYDMASLQSLYDTKRKEGHEGLIIKDPMTPYKRGKKTGYWKMKPEDEIDGKVVGLNFGTIGLANEGKVIGFQVLLENGVVVDANNASQFDMDQWTYAVEQHGEEHFNGRYVQVKFMERTNDDSLRHPSFDRWRDLEGHEGIKS